MASSSRENVYLWGMLAGSQPKKKLEKNMVMNCDQKQRNFIKSTLSIGLISVSRVDH